jgi:toxin FitB
VNYRLGAMDAFFAATAAVHGLILVTRNSTDFEASGITLLNPWTIEP